MWLLANPFFLSMEVMSGMYCPYCGRKMVEKVHGIGYGIYECKHCDMEAVVTVDTFEQQTEIVLREVKRK